MSIKKRGEIWWIDIRAPNGTRIRRSAGTSNKTEAQEFHDRVKAELWRIHRLGEKPRRSWKEAVVRWCKEKHEKKDIQKDIAKLKWLDTQLGHRYLDEITNDLIDEIIDLKRDEPGRSGDGVKPATINRYLALIRSILRRAAFKWQWLDNPPMIELLPEKNERIRWLTREEAQRLINALPDHYALAARFALYTGLRQSNVLRLQWDQVDLERACAWIHAKDAKAGRAIAVPLNREALEVLSECKGLHPRRVFAKDGKPFNKIESLVWKKALKVAEISDFKWHDWRHTWASWHVMAGTSLQELMALGSWKTYSMVIRYAHLSSDHLKEASNRISQSQPANPCPTKPQKPTLRLVK